MSSERRSIDLLAGAAQEMGLALSPGQMGLFSSYENLLREWSRRTDLTSLIGPEQVIQELLIPSICLVPMLPPGTHTVADVGSGSGIPGMPIAILSTIDITLIESDRAKCAFLERVAIELGLENIRVECRRAEDAGRDPKLRERFDVATARAVARLPTLLELVLPLVRVGGIAILPKGARAEEEVGASTRALGVLGGEARIEESHGARFVVVRKIRATPESYPRRPGVPKRRPL